MTKKLLKKFKNFIESKPNVRGGQYVFKGTRIPVFYVTERFEKGWSIDDMKNLFPEIDKNVLDEMSDIIFEHNNVNESEKIKITWLSYA